MTKKLTTYLQKNNQKKRGLRKLSILLATFLFAEQVSMPVVAQNSLPRNLEEIEKVSENSLDMDSDSISENSISENSVSENSVSEDSISENGLQKDVFESMLDELTGNQEQPEELEEELEDFAGLSIPAAQQSAINPVQETVAPTRNQAATSKAQPVAASGQTKTVLETKKTSKTTTVKVPRKAALAKPGKVTIKNAKNTAKGKITVTYKKASKATGYEILYSTSKSFVSEKEVVISKTTTATITNLPKGKTYYVKVRAFNKDEATGKIKYGSYSAKKKVEIKKGVNEIEAAKGTVTISSVKIKDSIVTVKAKAPKRVASSDESYYLFALDSGKKKISGKPIASVGKAKSLTYTVDLKLGTKDSILTKKFVIAVKKKSKYVQLSEAAYISNPEIVAPYRYAFPVAVSKKGLQINADMLTDVEELGVKNTAYNILLDKVIATSAEKNDAAGISYTYNGKKYWFSKSAVEGYDALFNQAKQMGIVTTGILLLGYRSDLTSLIYEKGRSAGHNYYMWNTQTASARKQLEATLSFLGERYGSDGRVVNWIVGNEVNAHTIWNYAGAVDQETYAQAYADEYRMAATILRSIYSGARVYISLDQNWTNTASGIMAGKSVLDAFAKDLKKEGSIPFQVAFHPYSNPMNLAAFWTDTSGLVTMKENTKYITMANISVLTDYLKKTYGESTRVLLSELGYTSTSEAGTDGENLQAAAIAYAYYLTEENDMIDALLINRHVDNTAEMKDGLHLGLWTTNGTGIHASEWASNKKIAWYVFKYMDTNRGTEFTNLVRQNKKVAIPEWEKVIPDFDEEKYEQMASYTMADVVTEKFEIEPEDRIVMVDSEDAKIVYHQPGLNPNTFWGYSKRFATPLDLSQKEYFGVDVAVATGSLDMTKATVRITLYSGSNRLEAEAVTINNAKESYLSVDLSQWEHSDSVDRIDISFLPGGSGDWGALMKCFALLNTDNTGCY